MNKNIDVLLAEPVWMAWCKNRREHLDKLVEMYYINPSNVMRALVAMGATNLQYDKLSDLIELIEATLNELERTDGI